MTDGTDLADGGRDGGPSRRLPRLALAGAGLIALTLGGIWGFRERIAADVIDRQLAALNLPARYRIESIGLGREVIGAVVVGDPAHLDLTVERVEIDLRYGLAGPVPDRIVLVRPRLYGRLVGGRVQFGALDRVIYAPSSGTASMRLPDWSLTLIDARGRIDSAYGPLAFSADGAGRLSDGFAGTIGAVVPQAQFRPGCAGDRTTLFGTVTTRAGQPHLSGPLRFGAWQCGGARGASGKIDLTLAGDASLGNWTIDARAVAGRIDGGGQTSVAGLTGLAGLHWQTGGDALSGRVTVDVSGVNTPALRLGSARFDGAVHARPVAGVVDMRGDLVGASLARGAGALAAFDHARVGAKGTPAGPLLDRLGTVLGHEEPGSRLTGVVGLHADRAGWRLAVPGLRWQGGRSGATLAHLDQLAVAGGDGHIPRIAGNFGTGGELPAITGMMTAGDLHGAQFQLAMAPYAAGNGRLAVPTMAVSQSGDGTIGFSGTVSVGGPIGGGRIDGLTMPIDGTVVAGGRVALLRHCVTPGFARLRVGSVDLAHGSVRLCPDGAAMVQVGSAGMQVTARFAGLNLVGRSGDAPLSVHAGAGRLAWPGTSMIGGIDTTLGSGADANRVQVSALTIAARGGTLGGHLTGGTVGLSALPATVSGADGAWQVDGGHVTLSGASFVVTDRTSPARFAPVAARAAGLALVDQVISGTLQVITPRTGDELASVALRHDLRSGKGHADVKLNGVKFREANAKAKQTGLQPSDLSDLAKGVIANANGTIKGAAQFDWDATARDGGVTGRGRFSSDDFDFAAAVGPVDGLAGTIEFTDLIHLITAPHQILTIASINPGIEVDNGMVDLDLHEHQVVRLNRAQWPFEGGTLTLEPTDLHMAVAEPRRFTLVIDGLDAGRFLQHINMSNLSATGKFDGHLPLVFDANGGRIVGGQLVSRAPGGNVSYVGALSYRDLSPMANFAFRMLRSVDYKAMTVGMEGDLAGEVVTRVSFGGIRQGKNAERNLITRQLAALPIRFDVNVRAQFYQLISSLRSLYDPTMVRSPRELGLVDAQGHPIHQHGTVTVEATPTAPPIQPQASGTMP